MNCKFCKKETTEKFCSAICYNTFRHNKNIRICHRCNKEFKLKNSAYEKRGAGIYCSRSCKAKQYYFNECFFDKIDTEEKAYWLGFLFADGSQNGNQFQMTLQINDKSHLEKFKKALDAEHSVKEIVKKNHKAGTAALFQISNQYFCASLEKQGCVKNKTFVVQFPNISKNLHRHFIRGVFDGDGTIGIMDKKHGYKKWSIYSASEGFNKSIHKILVAYGLNARFQKRQYSDGRKPGYNTVIGNQGDIKILYKYLYNNATVFLERKREKFI